jgi:hypothetical protein
MVWSLGGLNRSPPMRLKILEECLSQEIRDFFEQVQRPVIPDGQWFHAGFLGHVKGQAPSSHDFGSSRDGHDP